jgi:DNA-binding MarR family transcriptional regulator
MKSNGLPSTTRCHRQAHEASTIISENQPHNSLPMPAYLAHQGGPAALFTRLQRVGIHLEVLQREAMTDADASFGDFIILATLRREPAPHELPVSQIASYILRPMGSISQALDRIERDGLITRTHDAADRRRVIVKLSDEGAEVVDQAQQSYERVRLRVFDRLADTELDAIDGAVTTLLGALDADYEENNA